MRIQRAAIAAAVLLAACAVPPPPAPEPVEPSAWLTFGESVDGRPLRMRTIGSGPRAVVWIGGIHGNETEGMVATDALPAAFAAMPGLAERVTLTIVEDVNPDGRASGTRGNARGVDLNRNYPSRNYAPSRTNGAEALSEPEARALHRLLASIEPDLVMVAHSWSNRDKAPFVNFDGPAAGLAERFGQLAGYPVVASDDIHGTPGSLGSLVGIDWQVPILTIEWERGADPDLCWAETRAAILAVIAGE